MPLNPILLNPSRIAQLLGVVGLMLVVAGIASHSLGYLTGHNHVLGVVRLFHLNEEQNIPTFFTTLLLLFATLLLSVIAVLKRNQSATDVVYWSVLAFGFLYLAVDEAASIHELANSPIHNLWLSTSGPGMFHYAWVIPAAAMIIFAGVFFAGFLRRLPSKTRVAFLAAAAIYLAGALGMELIEGTYGPWQPHNSSLNALVVLEEAMEMFGIIVFIWALLVYITVSFREVGFRFLIVSDGPASVIGNQKD